MDIKVGDYVRTKDGEILKIDSFEKDCKNINCVCFTTGEIYTQELLNEIIVKHSKNIIDLIEVGDIIEVYFPIRKTTRKICVDGYFKDSIALKGLINGNIILKSILTHEQYNANCYKVKGE